MVQYRLINYFDVWGNKRDGWEVNNLCEEGIIELPENFTDKDMIKALKEFGFFKKTVRSNQLDIWNDYHMIEFSQRKDQQPICRLELVQ